MTGAATVVAQTHYDIRLFMRRPVAAFFVVAMPIILLIVFAALFGDADPSGRPPPAQFYAPSLAVFGAVSATYTYLSVSTAFARESGILKRMRGTPIHPAAYVAGRVTAASLVAVTSASLVMAFAATAYGVQIDVARLPGAALALIAGSLCFAALGLLVASLVRTGETAQAVTNATLLPLAFISDVFVPPEAGVPEWLQRLGDLFPLKHLAVAFADAFRPGLSGHGIAWPQDGQDYAVLGHVAVLAAWGIVAAIASMRLFVWEPKRT